MAVALNEIQVVNTTMNYKGYTASMIFDPEDGVIVGRVLNINDIVSFHGDSVTEFEFNFHSVIDGYIAACAELGSNPLKPTNARAEQVAPTLAQIEARHFQIEGSGH